MPCRWMQGSPFADKPFLRDAWHNMRSWAQADRRARSRVRRNGGVSERFEEYSMAMDLKSGSRWRSAVSDTEVIVVRAPSSPLTLECGGQAMVPHGAEKPAGQSVDPMF